MPRRSLGSAYGGSCLGTATSRGPFAILGHDQDANRDSHLRHQAAGRRPPAWPRIRASLRPGDRAPAGDRDGAPGGAPRPTPARPASPGGQGWRAVGLRTGHQQCPPRRAWPPGAYYADGRLVGRAAQSACAGRAGKPPSRVAGSIRPPPGAALGRGLYLVEHLARWWGTDRDGYWFELRHDHDRSELGGEARG